MTWQRTAGLCLLVPGGAGQLGSELAALAGDDVDVRAPGSGELDITSAGAVLREVDALAARARRAGGFPLVVNTAAYTAVDAAESDEHTAFARNADGPRVLAAACAARDVPLIHVSTDYVFAGDGTQPYEVTDQPAPRTAYGRTKAVGEHAVLGSGARAWVVRTSWLYGSVTGNFVATMARLAAERDTVSVVDDQRGCPTWSADLAVALIGLARSIAAGDGPHSRILHCAGGGHTTWYGFAREVFRLLGADPERVRPCTTAEFPRPAPRPAYSVLSTVDSIDAGLGPLRPWQEALAEFAARHGDALRQESPAR